MAAFSRALSIEGGYRALAPAGKEDTHVFRLANTATDLFQHGNVVARPQRGAREQRSTERYRARSGHRIVRRLERIAADPTAIILILLVASVIGGFLYLALSSITF
ncbi:hypothetical protein RB623_27780 [Mesorhizobium sp. LHD-90]|uniref:hypothetical protein n=1 Tax=Mesorhizobium sp. LHD-90 TaxID=3071414 RepID=UPI0027E13BB2|nr:hypothetical protein [Mesorhizobium sp. LHD-90]MDQ6437872.1 hypothetical protein [Mesorhizobium sp. LHD-90]